MVSSGFQQPLVSLCPASDPQCNTSDPQGFCEVKSQKLKVKSDLESLIKNEISSLFWSFDHCLREVFWRDDDAWRNLSTLQVPVPADGKRFGELVEQNAEYN